MTRRKAKAEPYHMLYDQDSELVTVPHSFAIDNGAFDLLDG